MNRTDPLQVALAVVGATLVVGTVLGLLFVSFIRQAYFAF